MSQRVEANARPVPNFGSGGWMVGPMFLALAAWFAFGPELETLPRREPVHVARADISTAPMRKAIGDPPLAAINGFDRTCMDCHRTFKTAEPRSSGLLQHKDVELVHGPNHDCLRCHDRDDRDKLRLQDGTTLPFTAVVQVCGDCHPALVRDWQAGSHGRTNGYWNQELGARHRLHCTECHDPHRPRTPAMTPLQPLPAPRAWRTEAAPGTASAASEAHAEKRDPLREALQRAAEHHQDKKD